MDIEKLREEIRAVDTTPPDGYLEGLEDKVLERVKTGGRRITLIRGMSVAASVAVLVIAMMMWPDSAGEVNVYSQVSEDVLAMHYIETYEDDWMDHDDWLEEVTVGEIVDLLEADGADEDVYAIDE